MSQPIVVIDPGHGATQDSDSFRVGPTGEREEWINLRVSQLLREILKDRYQVIMTRETDEFVELERRAEIAIQANADIMVSVHHNSPDPVDRRIDYPLVFVRGHVDHACDSNRLATLLLKEFCKQRQLAGALVSDHIIFENGFSILRNLNGKVPTVIGEYSFFSNFEQEELLRDESYCRSEALCYSRAIDTYFTQAPNRAPALQDSFFSTKLRERIKSRRSPQEEFDFQHYVNQASDFFANEQWAEAATSYETSLALLVNHPLSAQALNQLSQCYRKLGEVEHAEAAHLVASHGLYRIPV